jgi:HlyD family secretion protein
MTPAITGPTPQTPPSWRRILDPHDMGIGLPAIIGIAAFGLFFIGFGGWAALAELERGIIASGTIIVESSRKTVQHLEGGILADILVRDGDTVTAGDVLIRLDDTQPQANVLLLNGQFWATQALEARLIAERDGSAAPRFPESLLRLRGNPAVAEIVDGQISVFRSRREGIESQTRILGQSIAQLREQIAGLRAQIEAQNRQVSLIRREAANVEILLEKGLERMPRLLSLQRQEAEIEGLRAQNIAAIARAQQAIGETELRIVDLRTQFVSDAAQKLQDAQGKLQDLEQRLAVARDTLGRTLVRAPVGGKVVKLAVFTTGGVIGAREPLLDIVPGNDTLVVEVQVSPLDVDSVQAGRPVQLRFPGLNQRTTPRFDGRVIKVSADRLSDQHSGVSYYTAQIAIDTTGPGAAAIDLRPGMPVEAMIVAGSRTPLDYILEPLFSNLRTAARED